MDKAEGKAEDNKSKDSSMENLLDQSQHRQCMSNDNDNNCTESVTSFNGLVDLETSYKTQLDLTKGTSRKYSENITDENGKQLTTVIYIKKRHRESSSSSKDTPCNQMTLYADKVKTSNTNQANGIRIE